MNKNKDREITKIVCCCAFNDSCVLEHLQKKESYLIKLCSEPDLLEKTVDSIHPDIIIIDCTGGGGESGVTVAVETQLEENLDARLEESSDSQLEDALDPQLEESPDPQLEVNLACSENRENIKTIDNTETVIELHEFVDSQLQNTRTEKSYVPLIMPNYLPDHLHILNIAHKGQIIFLFDADPGMEVKVRCLENGCDVMVSPFCLQELDFRIRLHTNQRDLNQRVSWHKATLDRALDHIDKLKHIILDTREEFSREKELAYNSLKQINIMSNERHILKKKLHSSNLKLYENIKGINAFLCSMIESRSESKKGHSKRVAEISEFVADKIGFEPNAIKILRKAAMFHEVGTMLIPSSIMNKEPSQWSEYEKNMMMLHPTNGAAYLEQCPGFEKVAAIIRHLHENSDGTGLPQGLKKRYIPLSSKVLAGADVLDQIWIDQPHASVDRILELIEEYSGSRLDPSIVNFLEKYVVNVLSPQISNNPVRLKEIPVYQLKPGMVMGNGLFTKTGTKLFSPGTVMTQDLISMLEKYTKEYPVDETVFIKIDL
ncbi:MAG: HD domain-containing protein [Desulfamplus sp.]|nr:HD domain-containing protein [Desulfamplus sp.]